MMPLADIREYKQCAPILQLFLSKFEAWVVFLILTSIRNIQLHVSLAELLWRFHRFRPIIQSPFRTMG